MPRSCRYDTDRDGRLTRAEFERAIKDGLGAGGLTTDDMDAMTPVRSRIVRLLEAVFLTLSGSAGPI